MYPTLMRTREHTRGRTCAHMRTGMMHNVNHGPIGLDCGPKPYRPVCRVLFLMILNSMTNLYIYSYIYEGFLKQGDPQIIHFNGIFPYKPSILGYPHLWKPSYTHTMYQLHRSSQDSPSFVRPFATPKAVPRWRAPWVDYFVSPFGYTTTFAAINVGFLYSTILEKSMTLNSIG